MSWTYSAASQSNLTARDLTILDGLAAFSVHAWCRLTDTAADRTVLGKFDATNGLRFYHDAVAVNGKLLAPKLAVIIGGVTVRPQPSVDNLFSANVWHSFGGQWKPNDASGIKVWFDGVNECTGSTTAHGSGTTFPNVAADLYIGKNSSAQSLSWNGQIGEVGIWNEFLDSDEWAALNAGVPVWFIRPWALVFVCGSRQVSGGTFGEGEGEGVAVSPTGEGVGDKPGKGVGFCVAVGLLTIDISWGIKTTCSGGERACFTRARSSSTRQAKRLLTGGRL